MRVVYKHFSIETRQEGRITLQYCYLTVLNCLLCVVTSQQHHKPYVLASEHLEYYWLMVLPNLKVYVAL